MLTAQAAQAQTSVTLVSNTGQNNDAQSSYSVDRAQGFTTGTNPAGYTLTSVTFPATGDLQAAPTARIESVGTDNKPGGSLGVLTLSKSGGTVTATASGVGIDLAADTTYFVVLFGSNDLTAGYTRTNSNSEDTGAATGWSIGDGSLWDNDATLDWNNTSTTSWRIAIKGHANTAPTVANPIPDQIAPPDTAFNYAFPANTFADTDTGDTLTYTATRGDGSALPSWLSFDAATRIFSGTPATSDIGTVAVKVTANDGTASVSDTFNIAVGVPATVIGVDISSTPSFDTDNDNTPETYGLGETIQVQLTFSKTVTVTGAPRLKIKMDPNFGEFWANYASGSGTATLTFAYTVASPNRSTQGIAVLEDTLELNGGTIRSGAVDATLTHTGKSHDSGHQVDHTLEDSTPPPATPPRTTTPTTSAPSTASVRPAGAVGLRVVEAGPESIRLSWKLSYGARSGFQSYDVYRCTVADDGADCDPWDGLWVATLREANAWTDTDVTAGATYRYAVAAAPFGPDDLSRAVTVTAEAPAGPLPSAPTRLAVTEAGATHVRLTWQAPAEDANGPVQTLDIYRCNVDADPDCDNYLLLTSRSGAAPGRYWDNDDVEPGTTYRYAVAANRAADVPAPWSGPVTVTTAPAGAPPVGVSHAQVAEAPGAALAFRVSLGKAAEGPVTVDYATADGTATAGEDYTPTAGTLTFAPGERIKTVRVTVLDDAHDEGEETLTLVLSNVSGGWLSANATSATGTIENADPLPNAWLSRFGRTSAVHIVDILDSRFDTAAPAGDRLTLGGRTVNMAALRAGVGDTSPFPRTRESSGQGVAEGDSVSRWMPEQVRHDGELAETWGQSNMTPDPAGSPDNEQVTLTPPIPDAAGHTAPTGFGQDRLGHHGPEANPAPAGAGADATVLERALWRALTQPGSLGVDKRFLSQSSFHLSLTDLNTRGQSNMTPDRADGPDNEHVTLTPSIETARAAPEHAGHWSLWGQGALTRFQGADDGVNLDGEVLTGLLGLDYAKDRWLAGVALAYHDGDGGYRAGNGVAGDLDSSLVTVNPYLRYALTPRLSVWGTVGYGTGTMQLRPTSSSSFPRRRESSGQGVAEGDSLSHWMPEQVRHDGGGEAQPIETDLSLSMGALGVKGIVLATAATELALKSDALWVRTTSDETDGLQGAVADASRIRLLLSGQHRRTLPNDALLSPSFELGIRYDDGDAETGFGMELGGGLRYADAVMGLTVETRARALIAHEDGGYEEWGLGGSLSLDPGRLGRGLALRLDSGWGIAQSNAEALWQRQTTAGMAPHQGQAAQARLNAELGYGLDVPWTYAILTPYGGMDWAGPRRALRLGWRFDLGQRLNLSVEGERMESRYERADHSLMLRTTLPW